MYPERVGERPIIVLASTSRYRRELLARLGVEFDLAAPACDERLDPGTPPDQGALELARRKALSVASDRPGSIVVGSDQMAVVDGRILGKPGSADRAVAQLLDLAGRPHELWTAVHAIDTRSGSEKSHAEVWIMEIRPLTADEAERYVALEAPLDCAGGYRFEGLGVALFASTEGRDPTAITGLPLVALAAMLRSFGVRIP